MVLGGGRVLGGARSPGVEATGRKGADTPEPRFSLAGLSSSLNPLGDPWSTAAMPREDRATWKSNYFMKIIVSVGAALALLGQRDAGWTARVGVILNKRGDALDCLFEERLRGSRRCLGQPRSDWLKAAVRICPDSCRDNLFRDLIR